VVAVPSGPNWTPPPTIPIKKISVQDVLDWNIDGDIDILTEVIREFPQSFPGKYLYSTLINPQPLPSKFFQFIINHSLLHHTQH
jgi:hypothetical protein